MSHQPTPENERKRAWLNRYKKSLHEQRYLAETLQELRSRAMSISTPMSLVRSAPTGAHSDRVADSVQRIADVEQKLQAEQLHGMDIATEIIDAAFTQLPFEYAQVLVCQYIDEMNADQTARKLGLSVSTVYSYRRKALSLLALPDSSSDPDDKPC